MWLGFESDHKGKKVKIVPVLKYHALKMYRGSGGAPPRIPDLRTRWRRVVSSTPRQLYPQGKSPWYPFDRRLGGLKSRFGRSG